MPTVYYRKLIQELLLRLGSGGLPHKGVARVLVHKGEEGIVLGIFCECETQRGG